MEDQRASKGGPRPEQAVGPARLCVQILGCVAEARSSLSRLLEGERAIELSLLWKETGSDSRSESPVTETPGPYLRRVPVRRSSCSILYLKTERIDWIESANQYVRLHEGERSYLMRESMRRLEARLDPASFARIHRSAIVNLEQVRELRTTSASERWAVLGDGRRLRVSPGCWPRLQEALVWVS